MANDRTVLIMAVIIIVIVVIVALYTKGMVESLRTEFLTQQYNVNRRLNTFVKRDQMEEMVLQMPVMESANKFLKERVPHSNLSEMVDTKLKDLNAKQDEIDKQVQQLKKTMTLLQGSRIAPPPCKIEPPTSNVLVANDESRSVTPAESEGRATEPVSFDFGEAYKKMQSSQIQADPTR